jgi:hypothetical protein
MSRRAGVWRAVAISWCLVSALPLLAITLGILTQPGFPLGLGFIGTRGLMGLWVTLLPATAGIGGVVLLRRSTRIGAGLILAYSGFWAVLLASMLPVVWNAESSFCLRGLGVCITAAWLARMTVMSLAILFLLTAGWAARAFMHTELQEQARTAIG